MLNECSGADGAFRSYDVYNSFSDLRYSFLIGGFAYGFNICFFKNSVNPICDSRYKKKKRFVVLEFAGPFLYVDV